LRSAGRHGVGRAAGRGAGGAVPLAERTRRNPELVDPLRPDSSTSTLLDVLDRTTTPMGGRLLRRWLLAPLRILPAIRARHDAVAVLVSETRGRERLRDALGGVRDLERLSSGAATRR